MLSNAAAAQFALVVNDAMNMVVATGLENLAPIPTEHLEQSWHLLGHLIADDHLGIVGERVCYGFLARSLTDRTQYVAVIRGTHGTLEWLEDAEFLPVAHPVAGTVEQGFWGVYETMRYVPLDGHQMPVAASIATVVGGDSLIVIGHSLGAAVATYLTFDMAWLLRSHVSGCFFASPHPGDARFCTAFNDRVGNYALYDYAPDIVPDVPVGPDYAALPKRTILPRTPAIRDDVECHHEVLSYAAMLDPNLAAELTTQAAGCIL
jgi:triacylglycerol lipase